MADRSPSPGQDNQIGDGEQEEPANPPAIPGPGTIAAARVRVLADAGRTRSPTPPRALFRSTTGKGVAFTEEDVTFLVRYMEYKKYVWITASCLASLLMDFQNTRTSRYGRVLERRCGKGEF